MANAVKAYISDSTLRPVAQRIALKAAPDCSLEDIIAALPYSEASRILAVTEPAVYWPGSEGKEHMLQTVVTREYSDYPVSHQFLAESLAAFVTDGGFLDELAHDAAPEVYRQENFHILDMMIRNERVQA